MRNLGLTIALWLAALMPTSSLALGLGEIEVNSFLNQPLNAEIEVLSARPGEIDDLLVSLASREAFSRAGLARPRHLTELRFSVKKSEDGETAVILVTTRDSVKEPFLNFLVEADWSKGRLLREFTVLLDPPFYADQPPPAETAGSESMPVAESAPAMDESASEGEPAMQPAADDSITEPIALAQDSSAQPAAAAPTSPPASSEYVEDESQNIIQGDVLVVKGDTLWSIASRYKDDDHSMAQVMLAFQRTNPNAFRDGNINNMKVGAVLRAPSASELDALDKQAAYAEVLTQNGLWDDYVARVTGVSPAMAGATDAEGSGQGADTAAEQGELSLLMPSDGSSESAGTGDSANLDQLRTRLALAEEELEASRIENRELESRIAELQARVSKFEELQKMIEIEDDSLAQIQAEQAAQAETAAGDSGSALGTEGTQPVTTDAVGDSMKAEEEALLEELLAEEAAAQAEEQAALQGGEIPDGESEQSPGSDGMVDDEVPAVAQGSDQVQDDETAPAATVTPPAPVIVTEPAPSSTSMLDGILPAGVADMIPSLGGIFADPIILAAIGGVVILVLVLVLVKRRKSAQDGESGLSEADDDLFGGDDEEDLTPIHLTEVEDQVETDIKIPAEDDMAPEERAAAAAEPAAEDDEYGATAVVSAAEMTELEAEPAAAAASEQDDVLNEVDVYLAYGLYDNAEELLKSSLTENPDRGDYRSKLLDTYFATKNASAFVAEAEHLKSMGNAGAPYWDRVQVMGYELAPDNPLFSDARDSGLSAADLEIAKPQEADFDLGGEGDEDTSLTTDFNLGEEDTSSLFDEAPESGEAGDLGSTQELGSADETSLDDVIAGGDDEDEDLMELPDDIGEELEFSMDAEAGEAEESAEEELGLLDDLDFADEAAEESEEKAAAEEDDLGLDFDMDEGDDADLDLDDALELETPEDDDIGEAPTAIITPNYEDTSVLSPEQDEDEADEDIDLGMDATAVIEAADAVPGAIEHTGELVLDEAEADDDDEDISIIDFGGEDFVEPTELVQPVSDSGADDDDEFVLDDEDEEEIRTGTFAPGDFDEPTAAVDSIADIDDMDDLMLPDDVDEVSTKLDLARAFIDMGDTEGARGSLEEVMAEGNAEQKAEAKALLDQI